MSENRANVAERQRPRVGQRPASAPPQPVSPQPSVTRTQSGVLMLLAVATAIGSTGLAAGGTSGALLGAELAGTVLAAGLTRELHAFVAPVLLGPRGRPRAVDWAGPENPSEAPRIDPVHWELCGTDAYVWGPISVSKKTRTNPIG